MEKTITDGNAPIGITSTEMGYIGINPGLTKREYFAAMAMQGYCGGEYTGQSGKPKDEMARWSVEMADALIKALNTK